MVNSLIKGSLFEEKRVVVTLSGGKASAYCAKWAFENFPKEKVVLYFNDTKWEHKDLYRFLDDLSKFFDHPITEDSDGRSVDEVMFDKRALANNRMPFCSRILKAERLQKFCQSGDLLIFGISNDEMDRVLRIVPIYRELSARKNKQLAIRFPLIETATSKEAIDEWLKLIGIKQPLLYDLGFSHNNCSGGCVRAGKKQWVRLYKNLPDVYAHRETVEKEMQEYLGKDVTILKNESLEQLRYRIDNDLLSVHYNDEDEDEGPTECIGICGTKN